MLNKRTQILFDEKTYRTLWEIARKNKSTVGELVRKAVRKTYKIDSRTDKSGSLAEAAKSTYGAWENQTEEPMMPLADVWSKPSEVFGKS